MVQHTITRRRALQLGALGGVAAAVTPLKFALADNEPFKIGSVSSLTGPGAPVGKMGLVGVQMAVDRINKKGGIKGRPVKLFAEDDESKPDVGRRKAEKLLTEDKIDAHVGGVLSNICLACMPVYEDHQIVNMISVCLDTTITTSKCSRYSFRPYDYAPAQAVAAAPYLVNKMGKKWHIIYADYSWGQSTRDAFAAEIKKNGGEMVGATGIPVNTADMTPFLSKINGDFDGVFVILFGQDGVTVGNQAFDLGLTKKYKFAGDGAVVEPSNLPGLGSKINGFTGIDRYIPAEDGVLNTPYQKAFVAEAMERLKQVSPAAPRPDRYVNSSFEAMNCLKIGIEKSGFQGAADSMKLIEALEGLEMKEGDDFPQGDKTLRKEDHQAFVREFIYEVRDGNYLIKDVIPKDKTLVPPACHFST